MRKTIPSQNIVQCDRCGEQDPRWFVKGCTIKLDQAVLDWTGSPAASDKKTFDLCDRCAPLVTQLLEDAIHGGKP